MLRNLLLIIARETVIKPAYLASFFFWLRWCLPRLRLYLATAIITVPSLFVGEPSPTLQPFTGTTLYRFHNYYNQNYSNVKWRVGVLQEAERVQPQLFRQPRHQGQLLSVSARQHHRKDGAASVRARTTVLSHVRRCCPPLPQLDRRPRLGVWCHPHGSR